MPKIIRFRIDYVETKKNAIERQLENENKCHSDVGNSGYDYIFECTSCNKSLAFLLKKNNKKVMLFS